MNTTTASPLLRIAALLTRMRASFPECRLSLSLCCDWLLELVGLQRKWTGDARAIDDPLEAAIVRLDQSLPRFKKAFENDPPAVRHQNMRDLHAVIAAARETHLRTEALAAEMTLPETIG